jgi:DNA-binding NarL/FixJ family response regulator
VLALLASGRTNSEIAKDLYIAVGTVKTHMNNIYRKLGTRNRAETLARARELKLLP